MRIALAGMVLLCAALSSALPRTVRAEETVPGLDQETMAALRDGSYIYVGTLRKDGSRSTVVPVWFALMDNAIWFTTSPTSHKAKRIKRGSPLFMSTQGEQGPFITMKPEIIQDGEKAERLGQIYNKKYWVAWLGFFRPSRARNESGQTILLRLTPAQ